MEKQRGFACIYVTQAAESNSVRGDTNFYLIFAGTLSIRAERERRQ